MDLLDFAFALRGEKREDRRLDIEEKKLPTEEERLTDISYKQALSKMYGAQTDQIRAEIDAIPAELRRQKAVADLAQAKGMSEMLSAQIKAINDAPDQETKNSLLFNHYLSGLIQKERAGSQALYQQLQAAEAQNRLILSARAQREENFGRKYMPNVNAFSGTPYYSAVYQASKELDDLENSQSASPQALADARTRLADITKQAAADKSKMALEMLKLELGARGEQGSQARSDELKNSALLKAMINKPQFVSDQNWAEYVAAVMSGAQEGKDFTLEAAKTDPIKNALTLGKGWKGAGLKYKPMANVIEEALKNPTGSAIPTTEELMKNAERK